MARKKAAKPGIDATPWRTRFRGLFLAIVWNIAAWPMLALASSVIDAPWLHWPAIGARTVGLVMAAIAAQRCLRYRKDGPATLILDPPEPQIGAPFQARFVSARRPADGRNYRARIVCERIDYGADYTAHKSIWTQSHKLTVHDGIAAMDLILPEDLPHSHAVSNDLAFAWTIELDRGGYVQPYVLPIGALSGSRWETEASEQSAARAGEAPAYTRRRQKNFPLAPARNAANDPDT